VSVCDKVRTVRTGKDGKFRFPVERRDGLNPGYPYAFLAGHYHKDHARIEPDVWKQQGEAAYRDRDIYLARQQPGNHIHWVASGAGEPCPQSEIKDPEESKALESFLALVRAEQDKGLAEGKHRLYRVKVTALSQGCFAYDKSESLRCCVQIPDADAFRTAEAAFKKENLAFVYGSESFQLCVRTQDRILASRLAADALYP
jgi:hypothetical protein